MAAAALPQIVADALPVGCTGVRVALSGGIDSVALLHALCAIRARRGLALEAVHVHHGQQPAADTWARFCRDLCARHEVALRIECPTIESGAAQGLEAAARCARYRVLAQQLPPGRVIATAHHGDDQAETVLLQLLRGAGVNGLAAMAALGSCPGAPQARLWRPLLSVTRRAIKHYARHHRLDWCVDPSNADIGFDRNYLRHRVMPVLRTRWPSTAITLARSAAACGDAAQAAQWLAERDLKSVTAADQSVSITALQRLPAFRRRHLLRAWISQVPLPLPQAHHLQELERQLAHARPDAAPVVGWSGAQIRRYRDRLYVMPPLAPAPHGQTILAWSDGQVVALPPGCGHLIRRVGSAGVAKACFQVRFRTGGERIRPAANRPSRAVKTLLQAAGVPPWVRARMPLVYADGLLVSVAGWWTTTAYCWSDGTSVFEWVGGPPGRPGVGT